MLKETRALAEQAKEELGSDDVHTKRLMKRIQLLGGTVQNAPE